MRILVRFIFAQINHSLSIGLIALSGEYQFLSTAYRNSDTIKGC